MIMHEMRRWRQLFEATDDPQLDMFPADDALPAEHRQRLGRAKAMGFDTNKVWYHGSRSSGFAQFDMTRLGTNTRHPASWLGVFFTDSLREAAEYALRRSLNRDEIEDGLAERLLGKRVQAFYLRMNRPRILPRVIDDYVTMFGDLSDDPGKAQEAFVRDWRAELEQQGYDGVIFPNKDMGSMHAVIFHPSQARLITAMFDPARNPAKLHEHRVCKYTV